MVSLTTPTVSVLLGEGAGGGALAVLAAWFGERTAGLVAAVTNPPWKPNRDKHEQCREHVAKSLNGSPWARVVKVSDLTDNAVGLFHTTGPSLPRRAGKYRPLLPVLREFVLRPDTPLHDDVKHMITRQLDKADIRLAAICGTPTPGEHPAGGNSDHPGDRQVRGPDRTRACRELPVRPCGEVIDAVQVLIDQGHVDPAAIRDISRTLWEVTLFYCPDCQLNYCSNDWDTYVLFDEGFYDCTEGTRPNGHRHVLDD